MSELYRDFGRRHHLLSESLLIPAYGKTRCTGKPPHHEYATLVAQPHSKEVERHMFQCWVIIITKQAARLAIS